MRSLLFCLFTLFFLGGCAHPRVAMQPETKAKIKTIGLLAVNEPKEYSFNPGPSAVGVLLPIGFGLAGGVIGGGIDAIRTASQTGQFTALVSAQHPDLGRTFNRLMQQSLEAKGYRVVELTPPAHWHAVSELDWKQVQLPQNPAVDAVLVSEVDAGYSWYQNFYRPHTLISVQLLPPGGGAPLYAQWHQVHDQVPEMLGAMRSKEQFHFGYIEHFAQYPDKAAHGMQSNVEILAPRFAADF